MLTSHTPRIGYVVKRYPRYSETFIVNEILAHEQAGCELSVFALRPPTDTHFQDCISRVRAPVKYLCADNIKGEALWSTIQDLSTRVPELWDYLRELPKMSAQTVYQAMELAEIAGRQQLSRLHAHFATSAADVALLAGRIAGIPVSFTAHAKDIFHEDVDNQALELKLSQADSVVTVSEFNLQYLRTTFGNAANRVVRIYNGLDLDRFSYRDPQFRPTKIIAVGRLVEKKGFDVLLQACRLLLDRKVPFDCQVVGTGELESKLTLMSRDLGLDGVVTFSGAMPQSAVIQAVQNSAVMAVPCVVGDDGNRDGLPTVLLEAMALGTPCVATDVTGIPEIVIDRETGLLIQQRNPVALADGLELLLTTPTIRSQMAFAARALVECEFNIHRNAARIRQLFGEMAVDDTAAADTAAVAAVARQLQEA